MTRPCYPPPLAGEVDVSATALTDGGGKSSRRLPPTAIAALGTTPATGAG